MNGLLWFWIIVSTIVSAIVGRMIGVENWQWLVVYLLGYASGVVTCTILWIEENKNVIRFRIFEVPGDTLSGVEE